EVFVHASDELLLVGEELWLHVNVLKDGKPSPSVRAYLELLDREGNPVKQEMMALAHGSGSGYLLIPENLPSDNYFLRVYTRNSPYSNSSKGIYQQVITVINTELPPGIVDTSRNTAFAKKPSRDSPFIETDKEEYGQGETGRVAVKISPATSFSISIKQTSALPSYNKPDFVAKQGEEWEEKDFKFIPEIYGHILHGKLLSSHIDSTETVYLSAHGKQSYLFASKPNKHGDLFFETGNFKFFDYVIVQSANQVGLDFILESPFYNGKPVTNFPLPELLLSEGDRDFILDRLIARSVNKYYHPITDRPVIEIPPLLIADRTYLLDNY